MAERMKLGLDSHSPKVVRNRPLHQRRNAEVSLLQLRCSYNPKWHLWLGDSPFPT